MDKSIKIFYQNIVILLIIMISSIKADIWKLPTAKDIQTSLDKCTILDTSLTINYVHLADDNDGGIRCIATQLGIWSDKNGFNAKRLGKMLNKHQKNTEILLVVTYCNDLKKQKDNNLNKWASEAYKCFAQGRLGLWINNYIRNVYQEKSI